jgi:toluene monooxygenase system ferredoxin subunit
MMPFIRVIELEELWSGEMKGCAVAGRKVLLIRKEQAVRAFEDRCAHLGVPLSMGRLENDVITCSAHEWRYGARTGCGIDPSAARLRSFAVEIADGVVWVDVDREGP